MVNTCVVYGCQNRADDDVKNVFYEIPNIRLHEGEHTEQLSKHRRRTWISRINRRNFTPSTYSKVCADHFLQGRPADLYDTAHPDWAPSLKLSGEFITAIGSRKAASITNPCRYQRVCQRHMEQDQHLAAKTSVDLATGNVNYTSVEVATVNVNQTERIIYTREAKSVEKPCCRFFVSGSFLD